ncbi:MAG TPA: sensor histidine kinase [Streptosporangiaceae bacterium]
MAGQGPDRPDTAGRPYAPATSRPRPPGQASSPLADMWDWVRARLVVAGRGLLLLGLALTGLALVAAVLGVLALVALLAHKATDPYQAQELDLYAAVAVLVFWLLMLPVFLLSFRPMARLSRKLAGRWCGVPIAAPYLPRPWADGGKGGLRRRLTWLLTDQATWRDLLWVTVNGLVGWILPVVPAGVLVLGVSGVIAPYASGEIRLLAATVAVGGTWASPWLMRGYGLLASSLLAPTQHAELTLRVHELTETRSEALDTGAAEIRRIERDLHDGAQARLVAMGMTLDAAGQIIDTNPEAARALLYEARDASIKALAELRNLVRGIHPPILADRGLADAIRALALDTPMRIHLASDLYGRASAPIESAAYFAVSELLANVSKHAEARETWVDLRYTEGMLRIGVTDNGRGGADPTRGSGLRGIERRLAAFDGVLAVSSPPGGPTAVTMEIPCELSLPKTSSS